MKKILKITGITLLSILILLIVIPFLFQGKIQETIKDLINENINAKVEFSDVSLSLIKDFPNAHISVSDLTITNYKPFENEILATAKNIAFSMSIKELFKSEEDGPIAINSITVDETLITLKTDKYGNTNYDIAKESDEEEETPKETEPSNFAISLKDYKITKSAFTYLDETSNITFHITELFHEGHGVFSSETSDLDTKTEANISLGMDSTYYLNNTPIKLDAVLGLDLNNSKYTFKDNKGYINQLPIKFDGFIQLLEDGQNIDITFENPESDFKNFLALLPQEYSKDIKDVKTTGEFKVKAIIKGMVTEETIPTLDISITSNNASFKYPDLPKPVNNITINTLIKNTTGKIEDTYVDIKALNFTIDKDVFNSSTLIKNITENPQISANLNGTINLSNLTKVYPIELEEKLSGILKANINTSFDMEAIETNAYDRIKNNGSFSLSDFIYSSEDLAKPMHLIKAQMDFNNGNIALNEFKAKTGDSDISASGTINNLLGFVLSNNTLKGNFNLDSNLFKLSDFMIAEEDTSTNEKTTESSEAMKIPAFLDCEIKANAKTVVYDDLNLKDVKGALFIKDQQVVLKDLTSSIFDGTLSVSGDVSTKNEKPTFNLNLGADQLDISKSFKGLELFQNLVPVAKMLQGKLNSMINFYGDLDKEYLPNISSLSGNLMGELLNAKISNDDDSGLINKLESSLNFIDFHKLNLNKVKTHLSFAEGKVVVKPFDLKYEDINITVSGSHSFEKNLDYDAVLNVPAKYLGSDVNRLIGKIDTQEAKNIEIPVTANIGGAFKNPSVKTDLSSGVSNLTKQLVDIEKQKLLNKGKGEVKNMLGNIIGSNNTKTDSLKNNQNNTVKDVLGGIVSGNKTTIDSTKTVSPTKKVVKDVLGGLLGGKKK